MQLWLVFIRICFSFSDNSLETMTLHSFPFLILLQGIWIKYRFHFVQYHFLISCKTWLFVLLWGFCFEFGVTLHPIEKRSFLLLCVKGLWGKLCKCESFSIIVFCFRQLIGSDEFDFCSICGCYFYKVVMVMIGGYSRTHQAVIWL